jgi:hypothetical protein
MVTPTEVLVEMVQAALESV